MNEELKQLPLQELIMVAKETGTIHYSETRKKFMSTATTEAPAEKKSSRKDFTTTLLKAHREKEGVVATDRLSPEAYDHLGKVVAENHELEHSKGIAYVKAIDSQLRGPQKEKPVKEAGPNVDNLLDVKGSPTGTSWREYITDLRSTGGLNKAEIIKQVTEDRQPEIEATSISVTTITRMVTAVLKTLPSTRARTKVASGDTIPLGDLVMEKYTDLTNRFGAEAVGANQSLQGEAKTEFCEWYEQTRGGHVGSVERTGDRMAAHAIWDLNRRLKALGIYISTPRAPKTEAVPAGTEAPNA